jgi:septal ring factor EnvC (AmiA/AmiB activator)
MLERLDFGPLVTVVGAILVAIITGWFSYLQEERVQLMVEIKGQQKEITELRGETRTLQREVEKLSTHINRLERRLVDAGLDVPPMPNA